MMLLYVIIAVLWVRASAWTTCDDQEFCTNIRYDWDGDTSYSLVDLDTEDQITGNIINDQTLKSFSFKFVALSGGSFRLTVQDPENARFTPEADALVGEPTQVPLSVVTSNSNVVVLSVEENLLVNIYISPFHIEVLRDEVVIIEVNKGNRLIINAEETDRSLALDISFPVAERVYGIPQHAERLSLPTTRPGGLNAFRMFNVDYYSYPAFTQEALYGSIGVLYGISTSTTSGIFWMNAAQTFVDISHEDDGISSLFISETGALELFLFTGPTLKNCVRQYTTLTGVGPLPQYYNLGYHQSRYSYMTQEDVETVVDEFDNHNFPMDVIWLDIDHTDGYRYFTWNYTAFPNPIEMQNKIADTGRKMVAINDPHIKVEEGYHVYDQAVANDYFVKDADGVIFEGICWPDLSSYIDYFNPLAQEWYAKLYLLENYPDTTLNLFVWNDMNEPSVFELVDQTMPGDLLHYGGWQHRDVHNLYGFKQSQAVYAGLRERDSTRRPFALTRAHFAGSQRYAAMWTGDNQPTWEHFQISIPMILTESLAGMAFCGADIGGFTDNVEEDLLQRWYQAGAWYPFYRGHSGINTERREPYLFPEEIQERIREAIRIRYRHIPYWYTLFFEHELTGDPIVRPLSYHYPTDASLLDVDNQWLIGSDIMVAPVLYQGVNSITTKFPGGQTEYWYDLVNGLVYPGLGDFVINVDMDSAPYYYRGGSIIFRINDNVQSTEEQHDKSYTMYVCLDSNSEASGNLYLDDLVSFDYKNENYLYYRFEYKDGDLSGEKIHEDANFDITLSIDRIMLYRVSSAVRTSVQKPKFTTLDKSFSIGKKKLKV